MNILFVHEVDWLKKVVFDVHSLAEILANLGHRVYAIDYEDRWRRQSLLDLGSLKTREFEGGSRAIPGTSVSVRRPGFIKVSGLSRLSASWTNCSEIKKTIRDKKIDVVVLYAVPTNGLQAVHHARQAGVPVVFRSIDILHKLVVYPPLRPPTWLLERSVYSRVNAVLAITPHHARYVTRMGADPATVKLLPFPIDTAVFHPAADYTDIQRRWGITSKDKVIVFVGTLFPFSGLDDFLAQFPRIAQAVPEARLLIVGDGPQRPKLEGIIAGLGLKERVIITGFQPFADMPKYMNLATVCINTFRNTPHTRDIFPGKVIQYLACGRATVATPLLGITSLVPDESRGIVYADSAADMAEKVIGLLKSPERRQKLGQAGVDYVRAVHDQAKIAHTLENELKEIVQ